jgi:hypothetical protein
VRAARARAVIPTATRRPNRAALVLLLSAIALLGAMAVADTGRRNDELRRLERVTYTPAELDELHTEIVVADVLAIVAAAVVVGSGVTALVVAGRRRADGRAPDLDTRPGR